ncbi:MAG: hypothetical protein IKK73_01925 [Akkermansia sp.]|nr:hypothetical protein [Akkermansia sp.]MBR6575868.1 hypothetical protein [Akkermansia sp.]
MKPRPPRFKLHTGGLLADPVLGSASGHGLAQRLAELINTPNTTVYDKAIDSVYLSLHTGGSKLHHLVDGQHDIFGAFEAASKALPDDSLWQEIMGTAQHLGKDLFSVSGLPVVSLEPGQFHAMSTWLNEHLHIPKDWLGDMLQINSLELFGGVLSTAAVVVGCKQKDVKKLAELAASSGLAGALAANPISMCAADIALIMAWKQQQEGSAGLKQGLLVGAGTSGAAMATGTAVAALGSGALCTVGGVALSLVVGLYTHRFLSRKIYSSWWSGWRLWLARIRGWCGARTCFFYR